jgi:hypothetical protein
MPKNKSLIDAILSDLDKIDLKESLRDDFSNNTYLPILKDRSVLNKFGTLTGQQLRDILQASGLNTSAKSPKWDQHFFGPIKGSKVRLATFIRNTNAKETETKPTSEMVTFYTNYYTNYTFLAEGSVEVTPTDLSGKFIIATSGNSDAPIAYVKSPFDTTNTLFVGRRPSGSYGNFSGSSSPQTPEGHLIKSFASIHANQILQSATSKVASFSNDNEKAILNSIVSNTNQYPVLYNSIVYALVDSLNIVTSTTQSGTSHQAGNALLGHNYLTHNSFDETAMFSLSQEERDDIKNELAKLVTSQPPYFNKWLPQITAFLEADKKARSASSLYRAILNMFFSTFGNIFSVVSRTAGRTTGEPLPLGAFLASPNIDSKIQTSFSLVGSDEIYLNDPGNDKRFYNPFVRFFWSTTPAPGGFYYSLNVELLSLLEFNSSVLFPLRLSMSVSDIKTARLPEQATKFLAMDTIKNSASQEYDETSFLNQFNSPNTAVATVNAGNESVLRSILKSKVQPYSPEAPLFSKQPDVLYAGLPKLFMQFSKYSFLFVPDTEIIDILNPSRLNWTAINNIVSLVGDEKDHDIKERTIRNLLELFTDGFSNTEGIPSFTTRLQQIIERLKTDLIDIHNSRFPDATTRRNIDFDEIISTFGAFLTNEIKQACTLPILLVTDLLKELYNPEIPLNKISSESPSLAKLAIVVRNLQLGVWSIYGHSKNYILGGHNAIKDSPILQLDLNVIHAFLNPKKASASENPFKKDEQDIPDYDTEDEEETPAGEIKPNRIKQLPYPYSTILDKFGTHR